MITRLINNGLINRSLGFDIMTRSSLCHKYNIIVPLNIDIIYCKWKKILYFYLLKNV